MNDCSNSNYFDFDKIHESLIYCSFTSTKWPDMFAGFYYHIHLNGRGNSECIYDLEKIQHVSHACTLHF